MQLDMENDDAVQTVIEASKGLLANGETPERAIAKAGIAAGLAVMNAAAAGVVNRRSHELASVVEDISQQGPVYQRILAGLKGDQK